MKRREKKDFEVRDSVILLCIGFLNQHLRDARPEGKGPPSLVWTEGKDPTPATREAIPLNSRHPAARAGSGLRELLIDTEITACLGMTHEGFLPGAFCVQRLGNG